MKPALLLLLLLGALNSGAQKADTTDSLPPEIMALLRRPLDKPCPSFQLSDGSTNETLKGKVVLINFWFSGCHPCLVEFEGLNRVYDSLKGHPDFAFLSFTFEKEPEIRRIRETYRINYPVYTLSGPDMRRILYGNGYPTTYLLNREGVVVLSPLLEQVTVDGVTRELLGVVLPAVRRELQGK